LAAGGFAAVLLSMTGLAVLAALRMGAASQDSAHDTRLADAYERARFAMATEEIQERKYRLELSPQALAGFVRAAEDYVTALGDVAEFRSASDRALVRRLESLQRRYRRSFDHLLGAIYSHNTLQAKRIDAHQVDPVSTTIETTLRRAAAEHRREALQHVVSLSAEARKLKFATPLAFLIGTALVALFARLLLMEDRREMTREAEMRVLADAALEDSLTGLGNRRKLAQDLEHALARASAAAPLALVIFDLDGFKGYNDAFGHPAGDALLARLGRRLHTVAGTAGTAYRLGGDEFCLIVPAGADDAERLGRLGAGALSATGGGLAIGCSHGIALLPHEASSSEDALRLADQRLYASKRSSRVSALTQSRSVLLATMRERHQGMAQHNERVAALAERLAERLGLGTDRIETIRHAAELHDVGMCAIPDQILSGPEGLTDDELAFMRQHTIVGERILSVAPALAQIATLVRASHERHDGAGYPDGLAGEEIPIGARIVAVSDAYTAMTGDRPYLPYRAACSHAEAIRELDRCAGTQFDPEIVAALVELLPAALRAAA
jgi:diguanylate cyclase (GGDEF)-like protein